MIVFGRSGVGLQMPRAWSINLNSLSTEGFPLLKESGRGCSPLGR